VARKLPEAAAAKTLSGLSEGTTCDRADRPHGDCCFALAEQSPEKVGPAQLPFVHLSSERRIERRFSWAAPFVENQHARPARVRVLRERR
jgi:hypothetical protein